MSRRRDDVGDDPAPPPALRVACHVDASERGGSTASLVTLLGALDPAIDVTIMGTSPQIVEWLAGARPGASTRLLSPVRSKFDMRAIREHTGVIRDIAPDIVHVNLDNAFTGQYGLLAGALTKSTTVAVVHSTAPAWRRRQSWLVRRLARHVTAYVAVSGAVARTVEAFLGRPQGSVRVIHTGADDVAAAKPPGGAVAVIGAVGRLAPEKGYPVLLDALRSVPGCRLVLVGDGEDRSALEAQVAELGLVDRVEFAGWVEPPWTARIGFDVLALSSHTEGFPLVVVEAMLAGIPVVATAVGGVPEVVIDGETGLLVPPGEPAALARALERLVADAPLRRAMAAKARAVAEEHLTAAAMARQFEALYAELRAAGRKAASLPSPHTR